MAAGGTAGELDVEIVGLVQNAKYSKVKRAVPPLFFRPYRQDAGLGFLTFYVELEEQRLGETTQAEPSRDESFNR